MYKIPANTLFMGQTLVFMPECHSTNDEVASLANEKPEGFVVITNSQTKGRGQRGNSWITEPGKNLTFTILLKPGFLQANEQFALTQAMALGITDFLQQHVKGIIKIKWPNDILINNKKICGVLIENVLRGTAIQQSIVGIGLNVNQENFVLPHATSLIQLANRPFALPELFNSLLEKIEVRYLQLRNDRYGIHSDYLQALHWLHESHSFKTGEKQFTGVITGIDAVGRIKIITQTGEEVFGMKEIEYGYE